MSDREKITFQIIHSHEETEVQTHEGEYRNLMSLINDKIFVEDFGECKGIGRCGTCLVIINAKNMLCPIDRNEKTTLDKCVIIHPQMRLACQIMIQDYLKDAFITIVEERQDIR